jgi:hypothetical protein
MTWPKAALPAGSAFVEAANKVCSLLAGVALPISRALSGMVSFRKGMDPKRQFFAALAGFVFSLQLMHQLCAVLAPVPMPGRPTGTVGADGMPFACNRGQDLEIPPSD